MKKTTITEVHDYFRDKIVNGDYIVKNIDQFTALILVDNEYFFNIWHANGDYGIKTYNNSFMMLDFRVKDRIKIYSRLKKGVKDYKQNILFKEKQKELEELKKDLGIE